MRVLGIEVEIDGAGVIIFRENARPCFPSICRAVDAAFMIGSIRVAQRGYKNNAGIVRVNKDTADLHGISKPYVLPGRAAVQGFVNAIAEGNVRPHVRLAAAYVDN